MSLAVPLGIIMLVCGVLYAIPRTVYLGAILTTAFLGGAICAHFRLGEWIAAAAHLPAARCHDLGRTLSPRSASA
jgi:hypothetical protein